MVEMFQADVPVYVFEPKVSVSALFTVLGTTSVGSVVRVVADRALQ